MPLELNSADRADFESRLANYGLDTAAVLADDLVTIPSTITSLAMTAESRFRPLVLKTTDFDEVNRWIGVPEAAFEGPSALRFEGMERRRGAPELPPADATGEYSTEDLTSEHLETIRSAARAYLRGDARAVREFKPWIERVFERVSIAVWPFFSITVKSGSVLEFGAGPHVLVAHSLTIEEGGIVRSYGELKVDATILQKTKPPKIFELNPAFLIPELRIGGIG
jgi:hypothetical protein